MRDEGADRGGGGEPEQARIGEVHRLTAPPSTASRRPGAERRERPARPRRSPPATAEPESTPDEVDPVLSTDVGATYREIDPNLIQPNPRQPRQVFDEEALSELVHSIREFGLMQPIVVRAVEVTDRKARAADMDRAHFARRNRLAVWPQHEHLGVRDRPADGNRRRAWGDVADEVPRREGRRLGRTIHVQQPLRPAGTNCSKRGVVRGKLLSSFVRSWHWLGLREKLNPISESSYNKPNRLLRRSAVVNRSPPMRFNTSKVSLPSARLGMLSRATTRGNGA